MIRDRIEAVVRELRAVDLMEAEPTLIPEIADRLTQILAEEEGGWTEGMETSPEWDDEVTKIWVYGGRYSVPTIEYADRSRFTVSYVSRHPTHWAPCEPPPLPEPPPGARP